MWISALHINNVVPTAYAHSIILLILIQYISAYVYKNMRLTWSYWRVGSAEVNINWISKGAVGGAFGVRQDKGDDQTERDKLVLHVGFGRRAEKQSQ